jgi:uncharacterized protein (TIGR00645 family)
MERFFENAMYASRWILAPSILAFRWHWSHCALSSSRKFFTSCRHLFHCRSGFDPGAAVAGGHDAGGGLLVMVMFSGYENFVSQLDIDEHKEKLSWLGKMDASSLKNKVSIVAISSIHLLRVFMDAKNVPDNKLMWYVIIHLTFVLSAFAMGYLDKISKK